MKSSEITEEFARFVNSIQFDQIPSHVVERTKDYILDSIGCTMMGYCIPEGRIVARLGREFGLGTDGTILPNGEKTCAVAAAYVNCKLSNLTDADETLHNFFHIGSVPVFSALHAAQKVNASGKDLITAIVLGYEFAYRFCTSYALLTMNSEGTTDIAKISGFGFNSIAAAVSAAKILQLDSESIRNAMGIAGYYTPLPLVSKWLHTKPAGLQKYQDMGWFAFSGLLSALFTRDGYTGDPCIIDDMGDYSFWKAFGMLEFDTAAMISDLGKSWGIMELGIKAYPCCGWFQTPIFMLKRIMTSEGIKPEEIEHITVGMHPVVTQSDLFMSANRWSHWPTKDAVNADPSLGYNMACAAFDIPIGPQWKLRETMTRPDIIKFSEKISIVKNEECERRMIGFLKSHQPKGKLMTKAHYSLEARTIRGTFSDSGEYVYGAMYNPDHSLTRGELKGKFAGNCMHLLNEKDIEKIADSIYTIDHCVAVRDFISLFG